MPFRTAYGFRDTSLADEQPTAVYPNVDPTPDSFRDPGGLPGCGVAWTADGP